MTLNSTLFFIVCCTQLKPEFIVRNDFLMFVIFQNICQSSKHNKGASSERTQGASISLQPARVLSNKCVWIRNYLGCHSFPICRQTLEHAVAQRHIIPSLQGGYSQRLSVKNSLHCLNEVCQVVGVPVNVCQCKVKMYQKKIKVHRSVSFLLLYRSGTCGIPPFNNSHLLGSCLLELLTFLLYISMKF